MSKMITREMQFRVTDAEKRQVTGIAVPYEQMANGEMFARDSVTLDPEAKLMWQHDKNEPIGKIVSGRHTDEGFEITATLSATQRGIEAATLLQDGVINRFSVGFVMRDSTVNENRERIVTDAFCREVSLVSFPWYEGATVTEVRDEPEQDVPASAEQKGEPVEEIRDLTPELAEVRERIESVEREISTLGTMETAVAVDNRSVGEFIQALASGDDSSIRAYTGAVLADSVITPIDRDLTRIIEAAAPMRTVFETGTTPAEGMAIYFAQLKGITDGTAVQAAEGDDLGYYEVQLETKNVAIKTIGNYVQVSLQTILRSTVDYITSAFRGQAIALGNKLNAELVAAYKTVVAAQITAGNKVTIAPTATYNSWLAGLTDAALRFSAFGLPIETLVVDTATFKELMALQGSDGRPVLLVDGAGVNNVGTVSPTGLGGTFAGLRVVAVADLNVNKSQCAFVNSAALRQYTSSTLRLENDNAINLTNSYSLSVFSAVADEYPALICGISRA